jgi:hypothetical protein
VKDLPEILIFEPTSMGQRYMLFTKWPVSFRDSPAPATADSEAEGGVQIALSLVLLFAI